MTSFLSFFALSRTFLFSCSILRFTHRGLGVGNATGFRGGTHAYLDRLEAYLSGDVLPDWLTRRRQIVATGGETP